MTGLRTERTCSRAAIPAVLFLLSCSPPPNSVPTAQAPPTAMTSRPASATDGTKDILIYGPSLFGSPDNEATLAAAAGHNVTVADADTWSKMTTAQFAAYRAIVFGDPTCQETPEPTLTAAQANKATWSPVVRGNMVVIGSDPIDHQSQGQANQLTTNAINFAAAGAVTGLYMSLSCYYFDAPANTPVNVLSELGNFQVQGQFAAPLNGCPNDVTIVAPGHPVVQGITKPGLDNWDCSIHEAFDTFPAPLGVVVRDTLSALPYVIAGKSPKTLCKNGQQDKGNGQVKDAMGGAGGDFDFDECDESHQLSHRDQSRSVDFHSTRKDAGPTFDPGIPAATTTGIGLNNGQPVAYTLVVTDLGLGPGIDLYSLTLLDAAGATIYSRTGTLIAGNIVVQR